MTPLVSYAITVRDEVSEFQTLIDYLRHVLAKVDYQWEVVVLVDGFDSEIERIIEINQPIRFAREVFDGRFGKWNNLLIDMCRGEWIFKIDSDEIPPQKIILGLPDALKWAGEAEAVNIPHLHAMVGWNEDHIRMYGMTQYITSVPGYDSTLAYLWPDPHVRLHRNEPHIRWHGDVHERVRGFKGEVFLPYLVENAFIEIRTPEMNEEKRLRYIKLGHERGR